jgi:hypothetical protein
MNPIIFYDNKLLRNILERWRLLIVVIESGKFIWLCLIVVFLADIR